MICFVIAIDAEAAPVAARMTDICEYRLCGKRVICGMLCGKQTAIIVCGVGKVNAACGAQLAIDRFGAEAIINLGVAGALNEGCDIAKIYAISSAVQYDFDLVQINGTPIGTLNEFQDRWLPLSQSEGFPFKKLASGDRFNDDKDDFELISREMGADIRDMEGAAIAQVCIHAKVKFFCFKAISDKAGSGSTTEQYLCNLSLCAKALEENAEKIFESAARI